jgi:hypothetical protein
MKRPKLSGNKNPPPFWKCFASNWLSNEQFMLATLAERGLFFSILNFCWENETIPSDPKAMARMLGVDDPGEITKAIGKLINTFTEKSSEDSSRLIAPILDKQFSGFAEQRKAMIEGGRKGGKRTQSSPEESSPPSSHPSRGGKASDMNRNDVNLHDLNSNAVYRERLTKEQKEWLDEYDQAEIKDGVPF